METTTTGRRGQFGSRYLTDASKVFEHNAWDDVEWDNEIEQEAREKIQINSTVTLTSLEIEKYEKDADKFWNAFYCQHQNKFFKDRNWLFAEFEELAPRSKVVNALLNEEVKPKDGKYSNDANESNNTYPDDIDGLNHQPCSLGTDQQPCSLGTDHQPCSLGNDQQPSGHQSVCKLEEKLSMEDLNNDRGFPKESSAKTCILEVGCGVGNTVFPILQTNNDPNLFVYCCDFAESAIELVKSHQLYNTSRCHAFVCDVAGDRPMFPFPHNSIDFIILIFVLSAIHPERMAITMKRLTAFLKPGGLILFRDYGRYDMAQLRFKPGKCLSDNFYVRGDGTRVYFFTQNEIDEMLTNCGLVKVQNIIDRRLQVNRGKQIKMYRVWVQCKYCKPLETSS